jgi:N-acetylmuramoyl-L-alanine amidase
MFAPQPLLQQPRIKQPAAAVATAPITAGIAPGARVIASITARSAKPARALPLAGKVVGVNPGHNGRNWSDPTYINHRIWNGREWESCDTTGTETDGGYTEALFNWNVGSDLAADLRAQGPQVVLTRHNNDGVGPCVTTRAQILNRAHVDVAVAIHADGGPADGRGFAVLEPVADAVNKHVIRPSYRFAADLRDDFRADTGMPVSTYDGVDGLEPRDDLAGENLTTVPSVLIECGNMRNATDAAMLVTTSFQKRAAQAMAAAITAFLVHR